MLKVHYFWQEGAEEDPYRTWCNGYRNDYLNQVGGFPTKEDAIKALEEWCSIHKGYFEIFTIRELFIWEE